MTRQELRIVAVLAGIFALRMLGLCLLLPVFAVEALKYSAATPQLIGWAVGIYGLAQAILQVPFGMLSDRFGRKPLIWLGLGLIVLGSVIASASTSIYGLILGRVLQGCGAIGSVVLALLADQVRAEVRTMAMAILGISIGAAFALAFALGPWLNQLVGMPGIFLAIGGLALIGAGLLLTIPNTAVVSIPRNSASFKLSMLGLVKNRQLLNLNFGVFILHASLAAVFLVLPGMLQNVGIASNKWGLLYSAVLMLAMLLVWRLIKFNERRPASSVQLQLGAIIGLLLAELLFGICQQWWSIAATLVIFFTSFCWLEASLPTLVSKHATVTQRGAALGTYSCLQFLGMFVGGVVGGKLHSMAGALATLAFCMVLAACWLIIGLKLSNKGVQIWQEV
jgi:MFS family permease